MTCLPSFLTTLSYTANNALRGRARDIYRECSAGLTTSAGTAFIGLLERLLRREGYEPGAHYVLTAGSFGELVINGTADDASINAFLKDQPELELAYAQLAQGYSLAQIDRESRLTDSAYKQARMSGSQTRRLQISSLIVSSQCRNVSLSVDKGMLTPLFDGKTSGQRVAWLSQLLA